jgi:hypothetical protein
MLPGTPNGTWDPTLFNVSFNGYPITGWSKTKMCTIKRSVDTFTPETGAAGEESWTKSANRQGEIELVLMATSADVGVLAAMIVADELTSGGLGVFQAKAINGTDYAHAAFARITKPPDMDKAAEQGDVTFMIKTTNLELSPGGLNGVG